MLGYAAYWALGMPISAVEVLDERKRKVGAEEDPHQLLG